MTRWLIALALLFFVAPAHAQQNVQVIGPITAGDCPLFNSPTIIKDSGVACNGSGGGFVTGPLSSTNNDMACWNGATGAVLKDCTAPQFSDANGNSWQWLAVTLNMFTGNSPDNVPALKITNSGGLTGTLNSFFVSRAGIISVGLPTAYPNLTCVANAGMCDNNLTFRVGGDVLFGDAHYFGSAPYIITAISNNGSGKTRITYSATVNPTPSNGNHYMFSGAPANTSLNSLLFGGSVASQAITVVDATHFDLTGLNFSNACSSAGTVANNCGYFGTGADSVGYAVRVAPVGTGAGAGGSFPSVSVFYSGSATTNDNTGGAYFLGVPDAWLDAFGTGNDQGAALIAAYGSACPNSGSHCNAVVTQYRSSLDTVSDSAIFGGTAALDTLLLPTKVPSLGVNVAAPATAGYASFNVGGHQPLQIGQWTNVNYNFLVVSGSGFTGTTGIGFFADEQADNSLYATVQAGGTFQMTSVGVPYLTFGTSEIQPQTDAAIALGDGSHRFSNASLSGTLSVAGTVTLPDSSTWTSTGLASLVSLGIVGGTLGNGAQVSTLTATQPASPVAAQNALIWTITGNGSASQVNSAFGFNYAAGYTGASRNNAVVTVNATAGTAATFNAGNPNGNIGTNTSATGTGAGWNFGLDTRALNSTTVNIAAFAGATTNGNSVTNIGLVASGKNGGTTPVQIGAWIINGSPVSDTSVPAVSAALIADNSGASNAIALFQSAGTTVASVNQTGGITATLTNAAGNEIVCYNTAGGLMTYEPAVASCVPSDPKLKVKGPDLLPSTALAKLETIVPGSGHFKESAKLDTAEHVWLYADQVCGIDPRLCVKDETGVLNYDKVGMLAYVIGAIKELKADNDNLRLEIKQMRNAR